MGGDQLRHDMRAHRVADDMRPRDVEVVEQAQDVEAHLGPVLGGVMRLPLLPATRIRGNNAVPRGERLEYAGPGPLGVGIRSVAMYQNNGLAQPSSM